MQQRRLVAEKFIANLDVFLTWVLSSPPQALLISAHQMIHCALPSNYEKKRINAGIFACPNLSMVRHLLVEITAQVGSWQSILKYFTKAQRPNINIHHAFPKDQTCFKLWDQSGEDAWGISLVNIWTPEFFLTIRKVGLKNGRIATQHVRLILIWLKIVLVLVGVEFLENTKQLFTERILIM